jgi:hypothetical protein
MALGEAFERYLIESTGPNPSFSASTTAVERLVTGCGVSAQELRLDPVVEERWRRALPFRLIHAALVVAHAWIQSANEAQVDPVVQSVYGVLRRQLDPDARNELPAEWNDDPELIDRIDRLAMHHAGVVITVEAQGDGYAVEADIPLPADVRRRLNRQKVSQSLMWALDPTADIELPGGGRAEANQALEEVAQYLLIQQPPFIQTGGGRAAAHERMIVYPPEGLMRIRKNPSRPPG